MRKTLIFIFTGIVITLSACDSSSVPSNRIVIESAREYSIWPKIYAIDEKGAEISVSPPFSVNDVNAPSSSVNWSPNHEWVVYQTEETAAPDDPHIFIVRTDGTKKFELTNDDHRSGRDPVWSRDGNQIASYFEGENVQAGIYTVDVSCLSKGQECIFDYRFVVEGIKPSWSFDGKQIAFFSFDRQVSVISVENPENIKTISQKDIECNELGLAWSPVINEIAISCHDSSPGLGIFLVNSDGSNFRRITFGPNRDISPVWSPDGTKIAFISGRNNTVQPEPYTMSPDAVFIMNSDGSNIKQISPYNNEAIRWITWVYP